jgi:hypothetical protein
VASQVAALYHAARVMMPERDWTWLKAVKARLHRAAPAHARIGPVITSVQLAQKAKSAQLTEGRLHFHRRRQDWEID